MAVCAVVLIALTGFRSRGHGHGGDGGGGCSGSHHSRSSGSGVHHDDDDYGTGGSGYDDSDDSDDYGSSSGGSDSDATVPTVTLVKCVHRDADRKWVVTVRVSNSSSAQADWSASIVLTDARDRLVTTPNGSGIISPGETETVDVPLPESVDGGTVRHCELV
ncbi:hypothetical protein ACZ90_06760 [Streptomyces albus subsp. albus]|nr:hypothetical protein ACZ90_06760 [Streptomyces albus subsp. albus]